MPEAFRRERERMVTEQLAARGIADERVLAAMRAVPREAFVEPADQQRAYADAALGIGGGQTISQPWIVATIAAALDPPADGRLLEIGTGSGYTAAIFSLLAGEVLSVERLPELALQAAERLRRVGIEGVEVLTADGSRGVAGRAPFDSIAVHAAMPDLPRALLAQLAPGGRLVAPISGPGEGEILTLFERGREDPDRMEREVLGPCRFVPLLGREGYPEQTGE